MCLFACVFSCVESYDPIHIWQRVSSQLQQNTLCDSTCRHVQHSTGSQRSRTLWSRPCGSFPVSKFPLGYPAVSKYPLAYPCRQGSVVKQVFRTSRGFSTWQASSAPHKAGSGGNVKQYSNLKTAKRHKLSVTSHSDTQTSVCVISTTTPLVLPPPNPWWRYPWCYCWTHSGRRGHRWRSRSAAWEHGFWSP